MDRRQGHIQRAETLVTLWSFKRGGGGHRLDGHNAGFLDSLRSLGMTPFAATREADE